MTRALLTFLLVASSFNLLTAQTSYYRNEIEFPTDYYVANKHTATYDAGVVVLAQTYDTITGSNYVNVIKLNAAGQMTWYKRFGPNYLQTDNIVQCPDSGYFFCARDMMTFQQVAIKLDQYGNVVFSRKLAVSSLYMAVSSCIVFARNNGELYIGDNTIEMSTGFYTWHFTKLDAAGNVVWTNAYNISADKSYCFDIDTFSNGDIAILGSMFDPAVPNHGPAVARIDGSGNLLWIQSYNHTSDDIYPYAFRIGPTDHVYIMTFYFDMNTFLYSTGLIKTNGAGNLTWSYKYGNGISGYDMTFAQNQDILIGGENFMLKTDSSGQLLAARWYPSTFIMSVDTISSGIYSYCAASTNTGQVFVFTSGPNGETCLDSMLTAVRSNAPLNEAPLYGEVVMPVTDSSYDLTSAFLAIHTQELCSTVGFVDHEDVSISIYPSPASDRIVITHAGTIDRIELVNIPGEVVATKVLNATAGEINVAALPNGLYFVNCYSESKVRSIPILISH